MTDTNGHPVWQWVISAFGELEPADASTGFVRARLNTPAPIAGSTPITFNLRYPGQQYDRETGLYYNHNRYYDPYLTVGYTQADPIGLQGGWNRFTYVEGNPLSWADPDGLNPRGLPRKPIELMPLEGGGGGMGGGGRLPRWNPGPGEFKPIYRPNPAHNPKSPLFNPRKTPEPQDCRPVYDRSVPDDPNSPRHWWGKADDGQYYRFSNTNDGSAHFSGSFPSNSNMIPPYAKGRLD